MSDMSGFWTPSMMYSGFPVPFNAAPPRMTIAGDVPGCPVVDAILTPVTVPESAFNALPCDPTPISSLVTLDMAAVSLSLVTVCPYPVTTTAERLNASSFSTTLIV